MLLNNFAENQTEAGVDEAGRGCLAGPVVAAAVVFKQGFEGIPMLNDSKKLNLSQRNALAPLIKQTALAWAIGQASHTEIDQMNILNASILAMHRALQELKAKFDFILVDGNRFKPYGNVPYQTIIKGDGKYAAIAAASVLAKTYRDQIMIENDTIFPGYGWRTNVGYPTPPHRKAIATKGPTPLHRRTFKLLPTQTKLTL